MNFYNKYIKSNGNDDIYLIKIKIPSFQYKQGDKRLEYDHGFIEYKNICNNK